MLNRRSSRDEVTPQLAERIVERPVAFTVPDGGTAFTGALNTATLLETPTPVHAAVAEVGIAAISPEAGTARPDDPAEVAALVAGTVHRNGRSGSAQKRSARRTPREKRADPEAGQSTVELPVVILMALTVFLLCAQAIGWAAGLLTARAVAQEGARTVGIVGYYDRYGNPRDEVIERVRDDVRDQLPSWMSSVNASDIDVLADRVSVRVTVSTVIPGVDLSASSSAPVYRGG